MSETYQQVLIDFLQKPESYGLSSDEVVRRIDTHISVVFLAGEFAYKLKRAIRLPFVDFRDIEDRKKYCSLELEVNKDGAPGLYLGIVPVTSFNGELSLGGRGDIIDWLVKMKRFKQTDLFESQSERGLLDRLKMEKLTQHISECYQGAEVTSAYGGPEGIRRAFQGHEKAFEACPKGIIDPEKIDQLMNLAEIEIKRKSDLLLERQKQGFVRQCHGDLHLRNIAEIDGEIHLFDAIEFEPDYACIDILYDLSFLLMDLVHRGRIDLANAVFNRYLGVNGDVMGLNVLNLFMASRAAIRAHVNAAAVPNQVVPEKSEEFKSQSRIYLDEALKYLAPQTPVLIGVGGLSGSGKSTLSRKLALEVGQLPGAYIARSDMIRKRLMGVKPEERLSDFGYSRGVTAHTFNTLFVEVRMALNAGYSVIADAVFANETQRQTLKDIAQDFDIPFIGIWLEADQVLREDRVESRTNDVSDADARVVRMQKAYDVGATDWHVIDSGKDAKAVLNEAQLILKTVLK